MCACEPGFTCAACRDTPQDWRYEWDEPAEPDDQRYCDCGAHVASLPCYFPPIIYADA